MTGPALIEKRPCIRIGRERTQHLGRIDLDGDQWRLRTACGRDLDTEFVESFTVPTCDACLTDAGVAS